VVDAGLTISVIRIRATRRVSL